jgi:hypothetical protein
MSIGFYFEYGDWEFVAPKCIHRLIGMRAECGSEWDMEGNEGIIRNIWFWPDSFTIYMGNPSWGFPVEKALAGERIALIAPTLVST